MYSAAGQLISLIHRSNALGSSHGGPISECCSAASKHSPASSHTERKIALPRPDQ